MISIFCCVQISRAAVLKGHDFTTIPADADYAPGELLVRFAPKAKGIQLSTEEKNEILTSLGGATIKHNYTIVPGLSLVKLPTGIKVKDALKVYNNVGEILYAEPNYRTYVASTPDDPNFSYQWGLHNTGQTGGTEDADIDAPEAWHVATDSDIIVAVIDTGIDYDHPDLAANLLVNLGWDFANNDNDPIDDYCHGTHCAGIIGAVGNNNTGVVGVCWQVEIMNLKSFDEYGRGYDANNIAAIEYAVDNGAKVINASWGNWTYNQSLKDAIDAADASGVLFVAAAGNDHYSIDDPRYEPFYPAGYDSDNIISVMSTDQNDVKSDFSNWGPTSVDLGAPGGWSNPKPPSGDPFGDNDILSTMPTYMTTVMTENDLSTYYDYLAGTSMATPHVSGACALLWAVVPSLSHLEVKSLLMDEVDKIDALEGLCVSEGRLNLDKALPPLFCIKNSSDETVAWFDNFGNLVLKGRLEENSDCEPTGHDEFKFKDSGGNVVMIIDTSNGNMSIKGTHQAQWEDPSAEDDEFIIENDSGPVAYISDSGDLYLTGELNHNP